MNRNEPQSRRDPLQSLSRRGLITGAAAFAAAGCVPVPSYADNDDDRNPKGPIRAYVGSYTPNGEGIYLFNVNPSNGALTQVKVFKGISNPSWLAIHPNKKFLYAGNEDFKTTDTISAFAINPSNGDLSLINIASSQGSGPAHLSVHPAGKYVLVANYGSGNVAVLPILANGGLGAATDIKKDVDACSPGCPLGPVHAQNAPPGSFAISGHDAAHAHMVQSDPAGNFVMVNDLGIDRTIVWKFNAAAGTLSDPKTALSSPGSGPRHFVFHPNGRSFYSLNEESSTMLFMTYNAGTGTLTPVEEISTLPKGFTGTNFTSEVIISRDGKYVYAANRLHDTIAIFDVHPTGALTLVGEVATRGDYTRNIAIDPTGNFMFACNQRADHITSFRIDGDGRQLKFTGQYTPVGNPAIIVFP